MFLKGLFCGFIFVGGGSVVFFSLQDTGRVTITIEGENDGPVAVDDKFTTTQSTVITGNVLANDTDKDGDLLRVAKINGQDFTPGEPITLPSGAILTVQENGDFTYDPNGAFDRLPEDATEDAFFDYEVEDTRPADDQP